LLPLDFSISAFQRFSVLPPPPDNKELITDNPFPRGPVVPWSFIASLLEVGTGFHPELTGRENIFLNGAILGMTKDEIRKKCDEIVAFAEIEQFIDTPMNRFGTRSGTRPLASEPRACQ